MEILVLFLCLFFGGGAHSGAQGSLLALCSGIISGSARVIIQDARDITQVGHMQGMRPTQYIIAPAPGSSGYLFFFF